MLIPIIDDHYHLSSDIIFVNLIVRNERCMIDIICNAFGLYFQNFQVATSFSSSFFLGWLLLLVLCDWYVNVICILFNLSIQLHSYHNYCLRWSPSTFKIFLELWNSHRLMVSWYVLLIMSSEYYFILCHHSSSILNACI